MLLNHLDDFVLDLRRGEKSSKDRLSVKLNWPRWVLIDMYRAVPKQTNANGEVCLILYVSRYQLNFYVLGREYGFHPLFDTLLPNRSPRYVWCAVDWYCHVRWESSLASHLEKSEIEEDGKRTNITLDRLSSSNERIPFCLTVVIQSSAQFSEKSVLNTGRIDLPMMGPGVPSRGHCTDLLGHRNGLAAHRRVCRAWHRSDIHALIVEFASMFVLI